MSGRWSSSTRSSRLPADWPKRRQATRRRAHDQCEWITDGQRCLSLGSECDHIINNDDHSSTNLQWLCLPHHKQKTQREAQAARPNRRRRPEMHPGLLTGHTPLAGGPSSLGANHRDV